MTVGLQLPEVHRHIGFCCREWILATGTCGRCGLCGEVPTYLRPFDEKET